VAGKNTATQQQGSEKLEFFGFYWVLGFVYFFGFFLFE